MLSVLANLRINDSVALEHLKDSFLSCTNISDNWLINIRGKLRSEAMDFLRTRLGKKGTFFELLDDSRGWAVNALDMLKGAKYDYILVFNEDHMNIASQDVYWGIVNDMKNSKTDYIQTSWWFFGKIRGVFDSFKLEKHQYLDSIYLTPTLWDRVKARGYKYFILALVGIFHKDLLLKILLRDQKRISVFDWRFFKAIERVLWTIGIRSGRERMFNLVNKYIFRKKLRRFSRESPFDLEYEPDRIDILPLKIGFPKQELFVCIDDDNGEEGYQLIKRGLYPVRDLIQFADPGSSADVKKEDLSLKKGENYKKRYYEDAIRTKELLIEKIILKKGELEAISGSEKITVKPGQCIQVYPSVGYELIARQDSSFERIMPNLYNKKIIREF